MSSIKEVLKGLREVPGVKGSALVTADGIMIASALGKGFEDEVVAGLASFMITTIRRSLHGGGHDDFERFIMHSTNGKILLVNLGQSFLIVQTDQFARLETSRGEVEQAAEELRRLSQVRV